MEEQYEEKNLKKIIQAAGRKHLRDRLEEQEKQYQKQLFNVFGRRSAWIAAASMLLLLSIGFYYTKVWIKPNSDQLFITYFEPYRSPVNLRGHHDSALNTWQQAIEFYKKGQFDEAIPLLENSLNENQISVSINHFYLGISKLAMKAPKPLEAVAHFEQCMRTENDYFQQARWYKALAFLKMDEKEETIQILIKVVAKADFKKTEAQALLDKLRY